MSYSVRQARPDDLTRIEQLYAIARRFMVSNGNPDQWGEFYPPRQLVEENIQNGSLYVIEEAGEIHGVFYFCIEDDPTYAEIQGAWHSDGPYGVIHRIAGDGSGGIVKTAVDFAKSQISYLRMDTYQDNQIMQHVLKKNGFQPCGTIYVEEDFPMLAFDLIL